MPHYSYKCKQCKKPVVRQATMDNRDNVQLCDKHHKPMDRLVDAPALVGFDEYGSSN